MKNAALIPCRGLGDGIIFTIAANFLKKEGFHVTIFHDALLGLQPWLPDFTILPESAFHTDFARILYQNENGPRAKKYRHLPNVEVLYHNHESHKHPPLRSSDILIGTNGPIASCLAKALGMPCESGLTPPKECVANKYPDRIAIHPTSAQSARNWPREKFESLADKLRKEGWDPQFVMSAKERWHDQVPLFSSLTETAQFLFESGGFIGNDSGLGHLASALGLPTVTLSSRRGHIALWRPSFYDNRVAVPSRLLPKKISENKWKKLIRVKKIKAIIIIIMKNSPHKYNHKRNKLVRKNMKPPYTTDREEPNLENIEKHYQKPSLDPSKAKREEHLSQEIDAMKKSMRRKKAKSFKKKRSKRQNSNEVDYKTEPEHIHFEGTRWMEVVKKQTVDRGKRLVNKVLKRK